MLPSHLKRVLILNANQRSALSVTRSLGKQNISLITADETDTTLAGSSRYSQYCYRYPSPQSCPDQFIISIADICRKENIDILMPMTELTAALLLSAQEGTEHKLPDVILPFANLETVNSIADKCSLMRMADKLDIPIPITWHADDPDNLPVDLATLSYPIVLKPGKSWVFYNGEWMHTAVQIADNITEARHILASDNAFRAFPFMLQEFIPGKGAGVFALYNRGKALAFFAHQRLREKPPQGGVSVLSESAAVDPDMELYARKLLEHVNWHGVAMVEFRVTPERKPYLMEINTRFWGSLQLAVDAGVDFPWLLYQATAGEQPKTVEHYKTGTRLRWLLGDVDSLYLVLRDRNIGLKQKLTTIVQFLIPHPLITRHEVNRLSDIKPFFWELRQYIRDLRG